MLDDPVLREILAESKFFTTEWQLKVLRDSEVWYLVHWAVPLIRQRPPNSFQVFVVICQDQHSQVIVPCYFGLYPDYAEIPVYEIYRRLLQTINLKSQHELRPRTIFVEYNEEIRRAVLTVFPSAELVGSYAHRAKYLQEVCKHVRCSLLGIKTAVLTRACHFFMAYVLIISMKPAEEFISHWVKLREVIDSHAFSVPITLIERDFLSPSGVYHNELSYANLIQSSSFRVATPAIEGYHYRVKQLIKAYGVSSLDMLIDKVITPEEKHFSSKVAEVNLGRIIPPEIPEKFFFERSIGALPISTTVADIYALYEHMEPYKLAEVLIDPMESRALPQRLSLIHI